MDEPRLAWIMLPDTQVKATFVQDAQDAVYIGGGSAVAFQFFAFGWGAGGGQATFTIETSLSGDEDDFVTNGVISTLIDENNGDYTKINTLLLTAGFGPYARVKAAVTLGNNSSFEIRVQYNPLGRGF